jgi:hypothetical protein
MDRTADDYRMMIAEALRAAVESDGDARVLTLDRAFQGLPDTAHGGSVLAALDDIAGLGGPRRIDGHFLRRVPPAVRLRVRARWDAAGCDLELAHDSAGVLVRGGVTAGGAPAQGRRVTGTRCSRPWTPATASSPAPPSLSWWSGASLAGS